MKVSGILASLMIAALGSGIAIAQEDGEQEGGGIAPQALEDEEMNVQDPSMSLESAVISTVMGTTPGTTDETTPGTTPGTTPTTTPGTQ